MPFPNVFPRPHFGPRHHVSALPVPAVQSSSGYVDPIREKIMELRKARNKGQPLRAPPMETTYPVSVPALSKPAPDNVVLRLRLPGREGMVFLSILSDSSVPNLFWDKDQINAYLFVGGNSVQEIALNNRGFMMDFPSKEYPRGGVSFRNITNETLKALLRSRNRIMNQKRAERGELGRKERAAKKYTTGPPSEVETTRYIDFVLVMPTNDLELRGSGTLTISMAGGGEVTADARWFKIQQAEEVTGAVDAKGNPITKVPVPSFTVYPVMTWIEEGLANAKNRKEEADLLHDIAATKKERDEADAKREAVPILDWGFKCSIPGQSLIDAVTTSKHQAAVAQADAPVVLIGRSIDRPDSVFVRYKDSPGAAEFIDIDYIRFGEWQGGVTGIDLRVSQSSYALCYFDLYLLDKAVIVPLQLFSKRWPHVPPVHVILGKDKEGKTPALLIFPLGSYSYMAVVLPNAKPRKKVQKT